MVGTTAGRSSSSWPSSSTAPAASATGLADLRSEGLLVTRQPWQPVRYTAPDQRTLVDAVFDEMAEQIASVQEVWLDAGAAQAQTDGALPGRLQELLDELEQSLLLIKHQGLADERETRYSVASDQYRWSSTST